MTQAPSPASSWPAEAPRTSRARPRRFGLWLRMLIGVVLLFVVLRSIDRTALVSTLSSVAPVWVVLLVGATVFDRVLMALKWNGLLRVRGVRIPAARAIQLCYVGNLLGTFTPGAIGGEVYRVAALRSNEDEGGAPSAGRTEVIVASILLERAIGLAVIGVMAAALLPWSARYLGAGSREVIWLVMLGAGAMVGGLVTALRTEWVQRVVRRVPVIRRTRVGARLGDIYSAFAAYRHHPAALVRFVALTALEVLTLIMINYLAARSLGIDPPFTFFLSTMPLVHILIRLPISFEGLGVQEGLFAFFLLQAGFNVEDGVAISLLLRAAFVVMVILPGVVMMSWGGGKRRAGYGTGVRPT